MILTSNAVAKNSGAGHTAEPVILSKGLSVAFAVVIGLGPVIPPEHVHDMLDWRGHHHVVAHRHAEPHTIARANGHASAVEHTDPRLTLEPRFTAPDRIRPFAPPALVTGILAVRTEQRGIALVIRIDQSIHGPPRAPSGLRAPPFRPSL